MSFNNIRLETLGGEVVAYFAPNFEVLPQDQNELTGIPRPGDTQRVTDFGLWKPS